VFRILLNLIKLLIIVVGEFILVNPIATVYLKMWQIRINVKYIVLIIFLIDNI
jgi:hypothetical protein